MDIEAYKVQLNDDVYSMKIYSIPKQKLMGEMYVEAQSVNNLIKDLLYFMLVRGNDNFIQYISQTVSYQSQNNLIKFGIIFEYIPQTLYKDLISRSKKNYLYAPDELK